MRFCIILRTQRVLADLTPMALVLVMSVFAFCQKLNATSGTAGRDFYFGIFDMIDSCCKDESNIVTIDVTNVSPHDAHVRLKIPYFYNDTFYNIPTGQGQSINVTFKIQRDGTFRDGRGIHISSNNDVVVIVANVYKPYYDMMDVYNILPVTSIGTRYNILSYGSGTSWSSSNRGSGFLVTAVYDNTNLTVQFNNTYKITILLDALDVYQYVCSNFCDCDLSGTLLMSDKIITVVAGSTYTISLEHYDYLASEMIPTSLLSTSYIVPPLFPKSGFNIKVLAEYGSVVNVSNATHTFSYSSLMRNMYFESLSVLVTSSAQISIAQLRIGGNTGDQFITVVPGIDQYLSNYVFTVPHAYYGVATPHVAIIAPLRERDNIILDGQSVLALNMSKGNIKQHEVPHPFDNYTVLTSETTEGVHHFWHPQTDVTFGVFVYGFGTDIGYGFYPGYDLEGRKEVPRPTTTTTTIPTTEVASSTSTRDEHTTCFHCNDITHPGLCDTVQRCSENEVCYLERFVVSGQSKYRSGCREAGACEADHSNTVQHGGVCYECCQNSFCNNKGCGEVIPDRQKRGPICFHCDHVSSPDECLQVEPCQLSEICKIEKYTWFVDDFHYKMGCSHKPCDLASRSVHASHVVKRATLLCNECCNDDYCNRNCTKDYDINGPSIIG